MFGGFCDDEKGDILQMNLRFVWNPQTHTIFYRVLESVDGAST